MVAKIVCINFPIYLVLFVHEIAEALVVLACMLSHEFVQGLRRFGGVHPGG